MPTTIRFNFIRAARRPGAEGGVDLRQRRTWRADSPTDQSPDTPPSVPNASADSEGKIDDLPSWAQTQLKALRAEAAARRVELKKFEQESAQREQARLIEEGKFKELAEKHGSEVARLKPYEERVSALEGAIRKSNEARISRIREDMRAIVPTDYSPEKLADWLDANLDKLTSPRAPELDAGASGGVVSTSLTPAEREFAREFGLTDEEYLKSKQKAGAPRSG